MVEDFALNDFVEEGFDAVSGRFGVFENTVDDELVTCFGTDACGEGDEFAGEISCEQFGSRCEGGFIGTNIGNFLSAREFTLRVDRGALQVFDLTVMRAEEGTSFCCGEFLSGFGGSIKVAVASDGVEGFEGEAGGIDFLMAACAGLRGLVFGELLTDGGCASGIGFDGTGVGRWWWGRGADDAFEEPDSPEDGRGVGAVGGDFQDAGLREEAASHAIRWKVDFSETCAADGWEVIMFREALVKEGVWGGNEELCWEVPFEEVAEIGPGFFDERVVQEDVLTPVADAFEIFGKEVAVGGGGLDFAEVEPLREEVIDEGVEARGFH